MVTGVSSLAEVPQSQLARQAIAGKISIEITSCHWTDDNVSRLHPIGFCWQYCRCSWKKPDRVQLTIVLDLIL